MKNLQVTLHLMRDRIFSSKISNKTSMSFLPFNLKLNNLITARYMVGKEELKWCLFVDDIIVNFTN